MPAPFRFGPWWGWMPAPSGSTANSTFQVNAAANWYALGFVPDSSRTLASVRTRISAVAGTLGGGDVTCDLYDSTGTLGKPGSAIETGKLPTATPGAAGWFDWTGFTAAVTGSQQYWLVWKNVNGTPASNNCTFQTTTLSSALSTWTLGSSTNRQSWGRALSANSGATWSITSASAGLRVGYADGTYDGVPIYTNADAASGDGIYSARESGVKFTAPANAVLNVAGLAINPANKTGTPTGNFRMGLWVGDSPPTNLGYVTLANAPTGSQIVLGYFAAPVQIAPRSVVRVTGAETTQADAVGDRYALREYLADTDANSQILMPENGTCTKTYFDGSSWADATIGTSLFQYALLLDPTNPFTSSGGPVARTQLIGGGIR